MSTRNLPYGYKMEKGIVLINEQEAEYIRRIFDMRISGIGVYAIGKMLYEEQIPFFDETRDKAIKKASAILYKPIYIGDEKYPPVIDRETFEKIQAMKSAAFRKKTAQEETADISNEEYILVPDDEMKALKLDIEESIRTHSADSAQIKDMIIRLAAKRNSQVSSHPGEMTKVAAYCRVSTEQENQQNSYHSQISYYSDYISSNPDWQLAGIFANEGISGTQTKNRTQFNKMIKMARKGKIDIILCKSISRFARNTVDCLDYVRELRNLGVAVIFEKENINTNSMNSEFAISLYASFAQAESESISRNVTWGIEKSFREGNVRYKFENMLGYRLDENKKPYIIPHEAEIVRMIFKDYADGFGASEIADKLTKMGAVRRNGSSEWTRNHVYQILKNEKYVGDAVLQKTYTVNCITHDRKKNTGEKPMYLIQDCHEPIIDRKTYDIVRLEMEKRKRSSQKEKNSCRTKYCMSNLMICPYCGSFYKRTTWLEKEGKVGVWRRKNRMESGKKCPKSHSYHESSLHKAVLAAVNSMVGMDTEISSQEISAGLAEKSSHIDSEIKAINAKLAEIERKRENILDNISGILFDETSMELKAFNRTESVLAGQLQTLMNQKDDCKRNILREENARELLKDLRPMTEFDDILFGRIISKIEGIGKDEIAVTFCGGHTVIQKI